MFRCSRGVIGIFWYIISIWYISSLSSLPTLWHNHNQIKDVIKYGCHLKNIELEENCFLGMWTSNSWSGPCLYMSPSPQTHDVPEFCIAWLAPKAVWNWIWNYYHSTRSCCSVNSGRKLRLGLACPGITHNKEASQGAEESSIQWRYLK